VRAHTHGSGTASGASWSRSSRWAFYAAAILIAVDLVVFFWLPVRGLNAVAFVLVLALAGLAMWRIWRDEHTYG